jgi:hypothetical protein
MFATSMRGPTWPARLSFIAAGLFTCASAGTNLLYGWSKGTDAATSLVWAAVSLAVSAVFALSWPAVLVSLDHRRWSRAAMAFVALLLTGTYSVTAALGSAMGGRANAAIEAKDAGDRKTRAQATFDAAKAELELLIVAKPAAELQSLIDSAQADLAKLPTTRPIGELEALMRRGCRVGTTLAGQMKSSCPKYDTELARAWERKNLSNRIAELTNDIARADQRRADQRDKAKAAMEKAASELTTTGPQKVANSDAVALAAYLQGLGLDIDADRVNKLLVLLAVLVIECGGGLSLAVGMALGDKTPNNRSVHTEVVRSARQHPTKARVTPAKIAPAHTVHTPALPSRDRLLDMVRNANGVLRTGHRALGEALGISATRAGQLLKQLSADGAIRVRAGKTGSLITLAPKLVAGAA